eukprot:1158891-Pelagomonas_calceolata.AAC.3
MRALDIGGRLRQRGSGLKLHAPSMGKQRKVVGLHARTWHGCHPEEKRLWTSCTHLAWVVTQGCGPERVHSA